ncbi:hypothetical protein [Palaeococcus ferrophilus]|uniref:hypothetical protein n=1 Tax=Palaeococcus ferrophilus TaxID=83868 RepID=UPI00064EF100|nr:hypothetical protein [Palaeococcus ferrophilus]
MKLRVVGVMLLTILLTSTIGMAATDVLSVEQAYLRGNAKVFIFQPSPEGGVKLLKQGRLRGLVSLRTESKKWEVKQTTKNLHATPTPLVIYFTKDGKIGVKSFQPGKPLKLEGMFPLEKVVEPSVKPELKLPLTARLRYKVRSLLSTSSCPWGYEELNSRYCVLENWEYLKDSYYADSKTFTEWVPFMGLKVRTEGFKEIRTISVSWGLQLTTSTKSMWTLSVDGIPVVDFGDSYSGSTLKVSYAPEQEIETANGYIDRYLNLPLKYVIVFYNIPVYDKWKKEYASIPIAGTYPLEIMMSGYYSIGETDLNRGYTLTDHLVNSQFPTESLETKTKVIRTNYRGSYPNLVFEFQGSSGYTFYSTPIGGSGASWLWSKLPVVGKLSLTFSYSSVSQSATTYRVDIEQGAPNQLYYASILERSLELANSNNVEVAMYFTTIDDGQDSSPPCVGNFCPSSFDLRAER